MVYTKEIYEKAEQELLQRRTIAQNTQKMHENEIKSNFPHIYELFKKSKGSIASAFALMGAGSKQERKQSFSDWKQQNANTRKELEQELVQAGFPTNYLDINYTCPKCEDAGYKESYMCDCLRELLNLYLSQEINEKSSIQLKDFKDFDPECYSTRENKYRLGFSEQECMQEIFQQCKEYAEKLATQKGFSQSLVLYGSTGLGKTFLSSCIAKKVLESGKTVIFNSCENIIGDIESEHFSKNDSNDYANSVINCDLLIIDDLGVEFKSPFGKSAFYNIINSRINKQKPTIISTNLSGRAINDSYGDRIYSRLQGEYKWLLFVGDDIRINKK